MVKTLIIVVGGIVSRLDLKNKSVLIWLSGVALTAIVGYLTALLFIATDVKNELVEIRLNASTGYAYEVIAFSMSGVSDPEEIGGIVRQWRKDGWGAQIGAARTLCKENPQRLHTLFSEPAVKNFCRATM